MSSKKIWQKYEDVTRQLLLDIRDFIGLSKVESKQVIQGNSGTEWEIDVVAYDNITSKIILVECKHRTNSSLPQSLVGGFAYTIKDTNAERGIIVTTIGLQEGAEKVAKHEKITPIRLTIDVTNNSDDYIARLSNQIFVKVTDRIAISFSCLSVTKVTHYKFFNRQ
ncbi:restriction endonuclease [Plectonema cf. radiosum LEGE 06105]|uniref:Restriction endonuclease n=1 Tax=Plectonema cf. radiosum LEGE 06105 TaxID=945769 RepID=A0A8J7F2Q2_9CYAN|nr:restriction endonuclease [Plectonema radiosum]MBE9213690.1 restriction endonuclease [Plectonema cf. radiosum LEGE 06105]